MAAVYLLILFPAIFCSSLLALSSQVPPSTHLLLPQLHEAKLKVAQLESSLEELIRQVKDRDLYLEERENQILEMEKKINDLQSTLLKLKGGSLPLLADEKINVLEEEIRVLWATSRRNNFDLHVLESKVRDAEDGLKSVTSEVEKMADVVSEQWIQIQQFEQALQLREMSILKAQRQARTSRCSFLKFINYLSSEYLPNSLGPLGLHLFGAESAFGSYISQSLHQLERFFSTMKESHHELQGFIKREMGRHEFTAQIANDELVFFVASALIIFPILSAWMLLSSQLH
ncbi:uncharacterized protein LOC110603055 [Manihot esculenta]|uniref:Uncharacterized protein n=1 Tax=Manihot esculenta TaxID=3983 RepID=A0A2C9U9A6_MANES|nr:uncharacterized protein LOC110603055 [Manihot esculenta]OAY26240.1 hypothetical protein MANES_16G031900v8 [Manihot esculenta]